MFTGITEEIGRVVAVGQGWLCVRAGTVMEGLAVGDSINVNGVCLTVTRLDGGTFTADLMPETVRRSNLGRLRPGDGVNLERALVMGGRLGGHFVQGHIDGTGRVLAVTPEAGAVLMEFGAPAAIMRYVVEKGFIAVDGVSLTVTGRRGLSFVVSLVDFTRRHTTLGERRAGDIVNLEVDIIAKYVEALGRPGNGGITEAFLREHGFVAG